MARQLNNHCTRLSQQYKIILKKHGKSTNFRLKNDASLRICVGVYDLYDIWNEENKYRAFIWYVYRVHICSYPILEQNFRQNEGGQKNSLPRLSSNYRYKDYLSRMFNHRSTNRWQSGYMQSFCSSSWCICWRNQSAHSRSKLWTFLRLWFFRRKFNGQLYYQFRWKCYIK